MRAAFAVWTSLLLAIPTLVRSHDAPGAAALALDGCGGDALVPTQVITGTFAAVEQGSYVMVPFDVPPGTTQVRMKYCWDAPEGPTNGNAKHTLDLGVWDARPSNGTWERAQFRGWGGSSHPDVTITTQGFSTEAQYLANPKGHVPGRTTRGFIPGPLPAGAWAAELGVASVISRADGDADGQVAWRVEIALSSDPSLAVDPYQPARYDRAPARRQPGWYAGDFHVHAEHSALGDAPMSEAFEFAFRPFAEGGAGLDFITLSDYVVPTAWNEIGHYQAAYPDRLILRSSEIITYRGHTNAHGGGRYVDHRTGTVWLRDADGGLHLLREARPASAIFRSVRAGGGVTQINHPRIFPSSNPGFRALCRGCPWDYSDAETDLRLVDAIEIQTGPGAFGNSPNPFTLDAIAYWEAALAAGHYIAAVGSSDSHNAGRTPGAFQSPIGQATTVVYANELSERGVLRAVRRGRTYVKLLGPAGPDLRLEATSTGRRTKPAIMGGQVQAPATIHAEVLNARPSAEPRILYVMRNGAIVQSVAVTGDRIAIDVQAAEPGRYRLQLQRNAIVEALTTPIWVVR
jgi:hypothetical protein